MIDRLRLKSEVICFLFFFFYFSSCVWFRCVCFGLLVSKKTCRWKYRLNKPLCAGFSHLPALMQYGGTALEHITIQKYHSRLAVNRWREREGDGNIDGDRQTAPSY